MTHSYDPGVSLWEAYRVMAAPWRDKSSTTTLAYVRHGIGEPRFALPSKSCRSVVSGFIPSSFRSAAHEATQTRGSGKPNSFPRSYDVKIAITVNRITISPLSSTTSHFAKDHLISPAVVTFNQRENPGPEYSSIKTVRLSRRTVSDRFELSYLLRPAGC